MSRTRFATHLFVKTVKIGNGGLQMFSSQISRTLASPAPPEIPTITLNNGIECPAIGFGTCLLTPVEVGEAVKHAIKVGYRLIDCSTLYGNEREIGQAIKEKIADGTVKREDLFVVTKLWNTFHEKQLVIPTCKQSLENFGFDYIDLYLINWPVAMKFAGPSHVELPFDKAVGYDYDYVFTWKGMEDCVKKGLAKSIGVSNFNHKQLRRILEAAKIKPVMNQVEVHPNLNQKKLIKFCKELQIEVSGYSPFGSPESPWAKPGDPLLNLDDPKIVKIGKKYGKTPTQVILRYITQLGVIPIPKSSNKERIEQNIKIFNFKLEEADMKIMDSFNCNGRGVSAKEFKGMPNYPFDIEF